MSRTILSLSRVVSAHRSIASTAPTSPWTIGTNVWSGCIRMRNEDVIDLYVRVGVGTRVAVI
jgi:lipoprotein-anchoring transpeptidase ErfK/SrfK